MHTKMSHAVAENDHCYMSYVLSNPLIMLLLAYKSNELFIFMYHSLRYTPLQICLLPGFRVADPYS